MPLYSPRTQPGLGRVFEREQRGLRRRRHLRREQQGFQKQPLPSVRTIQGVPSPLSLPPPGSVPGVTAFEAAPEAGAAQLPADVQPDVGPGGPDDLDTQPEDGPAASRSALPASAP